MSGIHAASVFHENFSTMNNPFRSPSPLFYRDISKCIPIFHRVSSFFFFLNGDGIERRLHSFFFFLTKMSFFLLSHCPHVSMEKTKDRIWLELPEFSIDFIARQ